MFPAALDELIVMYLVYIQARCPLHRHQQLRRSSPNTPRSDHTFYDFPVWPESESSRVAGESPRNFTWSDLRIDTWEHQAVQDKVQYVTCTNQCMYQ